MPNISLSESRELFLVVFSVIFSIFIIYQLVLRFNKTGRKVSLKLCHIYLSKKFPDFLEFKKTKLKLSGPSNSVEAEFKALYHYFRYMYDNTCNRDSDQGLVLEEFFSSIEHLLTKGNRKIRKSIVNNFLSPLMNDMLNFNISIPYLPKHLGKNSRKHCLNLSQSIKPNKKEVS